MTTDELKALPIGTSVLKAGMDKQYVKVDHVATFYGCGFRKIGAKGLPIGPVIRLFGKQVKLA